MDGCLFSWVFLFGNYSNDDILLSDAGNEKKKAKKKKKKKDGENRKSKSKHRLKSAKRTKTSNEQETDFAFFASKQTDLCALKAHGSNLKIGTLPIRPEKPKIDYLHVRTKSEPERTTRHQLPTAAVSLQTRNLVSASVESMSKYSTNTGSSVYEKILQNRKNKTTIESNTIKKLTKVYLSDKHTKSIKELGIEFPGAPPATPLPG